MKILLGVPPPILRLKLKESTIKTHIPFLHSSDSRLKRLTGQEGWYWRRWWWTMNGEGRTALDGNSMFWRDHSAPPWPTYLPSQCAAHRTRPSIARLAGPERTHCAPIMAVLLRIGQKVAEQHKLYPNGELFAQDPLL